MALGSAQRYGANVLFRATWCTRMTETQMGKVVLVTGAGSGIGEGIAGRFGRDGYRVAVVDIDEVAAQACASTIVDAGGVAHAVVADVTQRVSVTSAVGSTVEKFGRLDVAVANAGIMDREPFLDFSDELWNRVLNTNLYGAFVTGQCAARQFVAQGGGGAIVNVASNSGVFGGRGRAGDGGEEERDPDDRDAQQHRHDPAIGHRHGPLQRQRRLAHDVALRQQRRADGGGRIG